MKKVLFLIHDLGQGGAEKVLVNLVNNMDTSQFDVTVMTLFDTGENRQFLSPSVKYKTWSKKMIRGNSHLMKILSPEQLHRLIIKERYDIEIAYLEGPCARIISGCADPNTRIVSWIHIEQHTARVAAASFRSIKEANACYQKFHKIICVSQTVKTTFQRSLKVDAPYDVIYNTNESEKILQQSQEPLEINIARNEINLIGVGKLLKSKGFDRILRLTKRLVDEGYAIHTYILGEGPERTDLQEYIETNGLGHHVTMLGYQLNPYKYIAKCDIFVCASLAEGFSTAATEALILGVPICTVEVSGMKEMLGEHNEHGIVTQNSEEALYDGLKQLLDSSSLREYYKNKAIERGAKFNTRETVQTVEKMLISL